LPWYVSIPSLVRRIKNKKTLFSIASQRRGGGIGIHEGLKIPCWQRLAGSTPAYGTIEKVIFVAGPTASGKSKEAIRLAKVLGGEVISVDSRQVYRGLDIGTEKITLEEMNGIPHHLIDIREPSETYSAGDFVKDAMQLIPEIIARGKVPILAGGTHFYFDALLHGLPQTQSNEELRNKLEELSTEELAREVELKDPARFKQLDPQNRRRLIRALEIISVHGKVPARTSTEFPYTVEWVIIDPPAEELRERIYLRMKTALGSGLIEEVGGGRAGRSADRPQELGLEYRIIGEYLRGERAEDSLVPTLSSKLWEYARRQKAWLRKLATESEAPTAASPLPDKN
jgi:tRNA dimethylallyltransferase